MKLEEFRATLQEVLENADKVIKGQFDTFELPKIDSTQLDIGQAEVWARIEGIRGISGVGMHHEWFDPDCEACRDLYLSDMHYAYRTLKNYLDGKLTQPKRLGVAEYANAETAHSVSLAFWLEDDEVRVRSTATEPGRLLAAYFKKSKHQYKDIEDIQLPDKLGDYKLTTKNLSEFTLFQEEL